MKFIFPLLAIFVCLGAAYFTFSQSEKFELVQQQRLTAISTNKSVSAKADVAEKNITDERALLTTSKDKLEVAKQSVLAAESTGNALKNELSKLDNEIAAQDAELAELQKALDDASALFDGEVDIDNLDEKLVEIEEEIAGKKTKVEELETLITGAEGTLATNQQEVERLVERRQSRSNRIARNAFEARITAVNQDWGFLVIGAGSNSGFTPQTTLLVTRDGRLIGKVNPSAIEPTQTIAEIDFKSLSPGVRIQPGDRVILAKPSGN